MVRSGLALSFLLAALLQTAFAAQRGKAASDMQQGRGVLATSGVRPFVASAEARAEMARYSLKAYENCDEKNALQAMLFTPKPVGTLRPAGVAYSDGRGSMGSTSVRMEGNPWTTLCPAPVIGNPTFPPSNLAEGEVAFGCLLLDTFVKEKSDMIKVIAGDGVSGIAPLRQEGAEYPFGVGFRIKKGAGSIKVRSEAIKIFVESANPNDEFASGKTMDADRITPNGGIVEWEF